MNIDELKSLCFWCKQLGIETIGELKQICDLLGLRANRDILNGINELYCTGDIRLVRGKYNG